MDSVPDPTTGGRVAGALGAEKLPRLGELVAEIGERFDTNGALGVLLLDAADIASIERRHGDAARVAVLSALGAIVRSVGQERLDVDDIVVMGGLGRSEIIVLFFRQPTSAAFYRTEMPGFIHSVYRALEKAGGRAFYPYLRGAPKLHAGTSVAIRNPKFAPETQLRRLVDEAREGAVLEREHAAKERRRDFTEMLLDRKVTSVYEPIVDVTTRTVFGYESLARGPEGTRLHAPVALFTAAIEHDLVFELDCLCRESGLKGAVDFPAGTKLFLNILPTTIHDPSFQPDRLIRTLEECRLSPSDVVFEISEQESIGNFALFREMSDQYRRLGFQFALDDTGSGYAGFEELIEIQPEFIKIDRSVVSGVDQDGARQEVLAALLSVAEKLGSRVIGEGLDTLEELETIGRLGIHFGQGWLFGHPTPLRATE